MRTNIVLVISIIAAIALVVGAFVFLRPKEQASLPISVQEYADFNCVHCNDFHSTWIDLQEEFNNPDEVEFEFIMHPILGSSSEQAAFAAAAADKQGKWVEYMDLLFENFESRADSDYVKFAMQLELDVAKFNSDRENPDLQARVLSRSSQAREDGITSTPTLFINGRRVNNREFEFLKQEIMSKIELAKSQSAE